MSAIGPTWCGECNRHRFYCECNPETHIFVVEYKLVIDRERFDIWCDERVRVVAHDAEQAARLVREWVMKADFVWTLESGETVEKPIPIGPRSVTIKEVSKYLENVGDMLRACPLPVVFQYEI